MSKYREALHRVLEKEANQRAQQLALATPTRPEQPAQAVTPPVERQPYCCGVHPQGCPILHDLPGQWEVRPTKAGYAHVVCATEGVRTKPLHVFAWQHYHGRKVPKRWHVHHLNGCGRDNRRANLVALSPLAHAREHSPNYRRHSNSNNWEKLCRECQCWRPARSNIYPKSGSGSLGPTCWGCLTGRSQGQLDEARARLDHLRPLAMLKDAGYTLSPENAARLSAARQAVTRYENQAKLYKQRTRMG